MEAPPIQPRCWKCGYELTGIRVEGKCPECGTDIWSGGQAGQLSSTANTSMVLGIIGLVLCVSCLGPVSLALAIPAIILGNKVMRHGESSPEMMNARGLAKAGVVCGYVTVGLAILISVLWIVMFAAGSF